MFSLLTACSVKQQDTVVSFENLLLELTNLERLPEFVEPEYKALQFSSYSRRSVAAYEPGWFDNSDGFGRSPLPGFEEVLKEPDSTQIGEYLICDVKKPGAIVRLWTANINGTIRLFLDNTDIPVYEGPAEDFFWNTAEELAGIKTDDGTIRQFDAVYFPIPFAKRCRIEWVGNIQQRHFYHVGMRLYEDHVKVITFSKQEASAIAGKLVEVETKLREMSSRTLTGEPVDYTIKPGESTSIYSHRSPGAVNELSLRLHAGDNEFLWRQCVLNIYFDGSSVPQVSSPLGDFFGSAPGLSPLRSLPFTVDKSGWMTCRFIMPFKDSARIEVMNMSKEYTSLSAFVNTIPYEWTDGESMHFRARWRIKHNLTASNREAADIHYLFASGKGRIIGASTYLYNPSSVPTAGGNWWGEGDEKIFVNGEKFPSFFGTGSEDYYNYSWSSSLIFSYPYCGQPRNDGPGNRGFVSNFRWHIIDDIPFVNSIAFSMELLSHGIVPGFSYGSIVYYYAFPETFDDYQKITNTDVAQIKYSPWTHAPGGRSSRYRFIPAEKLLVKSRNTSINEGKLWSEGKILMWEPVSKGEKLSFVYESSSDIKNTMIGFTLSKLPEGGRVSLLVNGEKIKWGTLSHSRRSLPVVLENGDTLIIEPAEVITLRSEYQIMLDALFTAQLDIRKGKNEIVIVNEEDASGIKIGVDAIWIRD